MVKEPNTFFNPPTAAVLSKSEKRGTKALETTEAIEIEVAAQRLTTAFEQGL